MKAVFRALLLLAILGAALAAIAAYALMRRGLSTRVPPTAIEALAARTMRGLATPRATRERVNPVAPTEVVLRDARAHFADHCAVCHANDGSGDTPIGRSLYPRAPDMRLEQTQNLTDGELFSIIEHGIRLTGMPAWGTGTPEGERDSWGLVHFMRRLPRLSPDDIAEMEKLNPRSPQEFRAEEEMRRILAGEDDASGKTEGTTPPAHGH